MKPFLLGLILFAAACSSGGETTEQAGATIFGPAVNVNTGRSLAWNTSRALAMAKPCVAAAGIPVHMNVGMGVGGVPMNTVPPVDAVSRVSKASVQVLRLDGL